ncbi:MAG: MFS transporter [Dehalococcoidia bacterium]|nr:MFS transporter [Dehalococcoidia bacterium]
MLTPKAGRKPLGLSPNVFFLGIVSFLTDVSSEMIFTLLPLFLHNVLQAGMPIIGLIEGIAESTATLFKVVSGWLSDRLGKRKILTAWGYGISTIAKPFLYFAGSWVAVLLVKFADRTGKGVRNSPRDALLADSTAPGELGKSFGFHRALDTLGAVVGIGIAAAVVFFLQQNGVELDRSTFQTLVLVGVVPAAIAVVIVVFLVHDIRTEKKADLHIPPKSDASLKPKFDKRFKVFLAIMIVFSLGNSSDAFLVLRAQNLGLSVFHILLVFAFFNLVYALIAFPAGRLSDKLGRRKVIFTGWSIYALSYFGFALASQWWQIWLVFGLYGVYYGIAEGVARAFVADMVETEKRGTAYGLFHAAIGISVLPASVIAGLLWNWINPAAPFYFGAVLAGIAAISLIALVRE